MSSFQIDISQGKNIDEVNINELSCRKYNDIDERDLKGDDKSNSNSEKDNQKSTLKNQTSTNDTNNKNSNPSSEINQNQEEIKENDNKNNFQIKNEENQSHSENESTDFYFISEESNSISEFKRKIRAEKAEFDRSKKNVWKNLARQFFQHLKNDKLQTELIVQQIGYRNTKYFLTKYSNVKRIKAANRYQFFHLIFPNEQQLFNYQKGLEHLSHNNPIKIIQNQYLKQKQEEPSVYERILCKYKKKETGFFSKYYQQLRNYKDYKFNFAQDIKEGKIYQTKKIRQLKKLQNNYVFNQNEHEKLKQVIYEKKAIRVLLWNYLRMHFHQFNMTQTKIKSIFSFFKSKKYIQFQIKKGIHHTVNSEYFI